MTTRIAALALLCASACSGDVGGNAPADAAIDSAVPADAPPPDAKTCDPECQFSATFEMIVQYSPADGSTSRATYDMGGDTNSPVIEFRFDEANGSFEEREGGACQPTRENPDFVRINVRALNKDLVGASVQASWDDGPFEVPQQIIDILNGDVGFDVVLPTDEKETDASDPPTSLCTHLEEPHFPADTFAWWQATFMTESGSITKRINFFKAPLN